MLGKLFKHDFKALSRLLVPTQLAVFAATLLGTASLTFMLRRDSSPNLNESALVAIVQLILGLMIGLVVLAIIAASFMTMFIIFQRFYKNFMCSEGYLTFTLPVTTAQLLWSKLLTAMLWTVISSIVITLCVFIFLIFGTASHGLVSTEFLRALGEMFRAIGQYFTGYMTLLGAEIIVMMVIAVAQQILHIYLAIILGGVVAKQHKVLAAIGFYFAINMGLSILISVGQILLLRNDFFFNDVIFRGTMNTPANAVDSINAIIISVQPMICYVIAISALVSAGCFIASHYLLKNKLNLE